MQTVDGLLLSIFTAEDYEHEKELLYKKIVHELHSASIAGVTVMRGIMGYGSAKQQVREVHLADIFEGLPIVIDAVDTREKIEDFIAEHKGLLTHCTVTTSKIDLWK